MSQRELSEFVEATATDLGIPGVAVGVWADGRETYVCRGVTSLGGPLPIDEDTLFVLGSVTKPFTATALMRLVSQGTVELEAPVRRYVPELRLADEAVAAEITVLQLLNHTAGLDWRVDVDSGEGDDALAREAAKLGESRLVGRPGARASYSTAGYDLAGRIIEKVTGLTYEQAVSSLVLEPLDLSHSFFDRDDVMTRRFSLGHNPAADGGMSIARPWRHWRSDNPGGGLVSSVADQVRWARFHLGDGSSQRGEQILPAGMLHRMKEQTVELRGSSLGDGIGICWFLREIGGVHTVGHAGSANGQFAELLMAPERDFAVVALSNAFPNGTPFNRAVVTWALEAYLGVTDRDPEPLPDDQARAAEVVGEYGNDYMTLTITSDSSGLTLDARIRPEIRAKATSDPPPDLDPAAIGLLPGGRDEYIVTTGGLTGQRGFFTRDEHGTVIGVDLAGRFFERVPFIGLI